MQSSLSSYNQSLMLLMMLPFIIIVVGLIIVLARNKRLMLEEQKSLICKDEILNEFKKIRHDYNNLLQGLVSAIEEEDWKALVHYKDSVLEKVRQLNKNNLTQLARIKDKSILTMVYHMLLKSQTSRISISLTTYNDIEDLSVYRNQFSKALQPYLSYAYALAAAEAEEISLKISADAEGLCFTFESRASNDNTVSNSVKRQRALKPCKNIIFNTFVKNDVLIQEILFPFSD